MSTQLKKVESVIEECDKKISDVEKCGSGASEIKASLDGISADLAKCLAKANEPDESKRLYGPKVCKRINDLNTQFQSLQQRLAKLPKSESKAQKVDKPDIPDTKETTEGEAMKSEASKGVNSHPNTIPSSDTSGTSVSSTTVLSTPSVVPSVTPTVKETASVPAKSVPGSTPASIPTSTPSITSITPPTTSSVSTPSSTPTVKSSESTDVKQISADGLDGFRSALLVLQSDNDSVQYQAALHTLQKCISNIVSNPNEPKYRRIRKDHDLFNKRLGSRSGGIESLESLGFAHQDKLLVLEPTPERWQRLVAAQAIVDDLLHPKAKPSSSDSASSTSSSSSSSPSSTANLSQNLSGLLGQILQPGGTALSDLFGGANIQGFQEIIARGAQNPMFQNLIANPDQILGLMQSPMVQGILNNPETMQQMIGSVSNDPNVVQLLQQVLGNNPAQFMNSVTGLLGRGGADAPIAQAPSVAPEVAPAAAEDEGDEEEAEEQEEEQEEQEDEEALMQEALRLSMQEDAQRNQQQRQ